MFLLFSRAKELLTNVSIRVRGHGHADIFRLLWPWRIQLAIPDRKNHRREGFRIDGLKARNRGGTGTARSWSGSSAVIDIPENFIGIIMGKPSEAAAAK